MQKEKTKTDFYRARKLREIKTSEEVYNIT